MSYGGRRRYRRARPRPSTPAPARPPAATDEHDEHRFALLGTELIDAESVDRGRDAELRAASKRSELLCPICRDPLIAKLGEVVRWHFAHRADAEFPGHEPESDMHKLGKKRLREHAQRLWPHAAIREEWRLPEIRQIADVLAASPGRRAVALEIQYADLSPRSWRLRHAGYQSMGIDDCWILGHSRMRLKGAATITLDTLASAIVGARQQLMYLQPRSGIVTWVRVAPAVVFRASAGERIGATEALVIRRPLECLRFDGGQPYLVDQEEPAEVG